LCIAWDTWRPLLCDSWSHRSYALDGVFISGEAPLGRKRGWHPIFRGKYRPRTPTGQRLCHPSLFHSTPGHMRPRDNAHFEQEAQQVNGHGISRVVGQLREILCVHPVLISLADCSAAPCRWPGLKLKTWVIATVIQTPQRYSIVCVGIGHHDNQTSDLQTSRTLRLWDTTD
jgi:hypothetical protein